MPIPYIICDAHVDNVVLAGVMDVVRSMAVSQLVVSQFNHLEDLLSDLPKIAHTLRVFGENRVTTGYDTVQDRHYSKIYTFSLRSDSAQKLSFVVLRIYQNKEPSTATG